MAYFKVDLYTPAGAVVKGESADSLFIPTCQGEINILPEHTHIVSSLSTGVVTLKAASGDRHFSVTAGICKVLKNHVTILALTSEKAEAIDLERAQKAQQRAKEKLSGKTHLEELELVKYRRKLERAEMRIRLAYLKGA